MSFIEDPGVDVYEGLNLSDLNVDEAYIRITSNSDTPVYLYGLSEECYGCPYTGPLTSLTSQTNLTLSTKHSWSFLLSDKNTSYIPVDETSDFEICTPLEDVHLGEFGVYDLTVGSECTFTTAKDPVFEYGALIIALCVYIFIGLLNQGHRWADRKGYIARILSCGRISKQNIEMSAAAMAEKVPPGKVRLKSLDTFRGISIVLMIFVNYGAGGYWFMEHATWNGLQVADLVFPWFMWIMGVCIPMGLKSQLRRNIAKRVIFLRIVKRSIKLFFIGIVLNSLGGYMDLEKYRVPGVLQRFAIAYLVTGSVALFLAGDASKEYKNKVMMYCKDILYLLPQWGFYLILVTIHTCITFLMPVEGCPTGYIGPGGYALIMDGGPKPDCIGGATLQVDKWLVGLSHMYQNPTAKWVYQSSAFDPEGVLGSLNAIFQVFLGIQAGYTLQFFTDHGSRVRRWFLWCFITGAVGTILTYASMNDGPIPVNKNLWSLSYVMVTSCFAFFLLAVCYLLVDVLNVWEGSPFYQAGMNGIFLYVGHNSCYALFPFHYVIGRMNTHIELLTECLWGTSLWVIIALYLHHKKRFYTV